MTDSGIPTCHLWLPNRGDAHTFVLIMVPTALQKSARHGHFQEKEKNADY